MKIHEGELSDATRYIEAQQHVTLEEKQADFDHILRMVRRLKSVGANTKFLEIGSGIGWFPILCERNGIKCEALEISAQLIDYAKRFGRRHGVDLDIKLGNIEDTDIGRSAYDAIVGSTVFEHVEHWQRGIRRVLAALKPGGLFFFTSTNKFSLEPTEYRLPFYGWLPDRWRYRLRVALQGDDIMRFGIDFNQFTYGQLRRFFRGVGFSRVLDPVEMCDPDHLSNPRAWKRPALILLKRLPLLKDMALLFPRVTFFICIK